MTTHTVHKVQGQMFLSSIPNATLTGDGRAEAVSTARPRRFGPWGHLFPGGRTHRGRHKLPGVPGLGKARMGVCANPVEQGGVE